MPVDRQLRFDLAKKVRLSERRLYELAAKVKSDHGPMGTDDAMYVLAHLNGLDLMRYIDDRDAVDRVRVIVDRVRADLPRGEVARPPARPQAPATTGKPHTPVTRTIRVGSVSAAADLMLPKSVEDDAERMANLYPKIYLLENSIRTVISRVMKAKHGPEWWSTCVSTGVRNKVQGRKEKEERAPWHGTRGTHDIYYSDFADLKDIVVKNWVDFEDIFPNQPWITVKLEELEPARNTLAHHNPVPAKEQTRFDVYFDDWAKLVAAKKDLIT
jgi:hypothetical protein